MYLPFLALSSDKCILSLGVFLPQSSFALASVPFGLFKVTFLVLLYLFYLLFQFGATLFLFSSCAAHGRIEILSENQHSTSNSCDT